MKDLQYDWKSWSRTTEKTKLNREGKNHSLVIVISSQTQTEGPIIRPINSDTSGSESHPSPVPTACRESVTPYLSSPFGET